MTDKMDRESAELELERCAYAMRVDMDLGDRDENDKTDAVKFRKQMVDAIMSGWAAVLDDGRYSIIPGDPDYSGDPIVFSKPKGSAYISMDMRKAAHDFAKLYASMADMTGIPSGTFSRLDAADVQLCIAVWSFLLGV